MANIGKNFIFISEWFHKFKQKRNPQENKVFNSSKSLRCEEFTKTLPIRNWSGVEESDTLLMDVVDSVPGVLWYTNKHCKDKIPMSSIP